MTKPENSRREELKKMLPKKVGTEERRCYNYDYGLGYNQAIDDCLEALEDKVILKSELLSVEEIRKIIEIYMIENNCCIDQEYIIEITQQIHDRQEGK